MLHTNTPPLWTKRLLSLAVVLALLLAYLPAGLAVNAAEGSLIPETVSRIVYVSAEGSDAETVNGGTGDPFNTLEYAMERLSAADSTADAVIVIVGTITSSSSYNIYSKGAYVNTLTTDAAESHSGTYYITGSYGVYTDGKIEFKKSSGTNYNFGGPVVIENITLEQTKDKTLNLHSSSSLIIGSGVIVKDSYNRISIIGGDYNAAVDNVTIKISSGTWAAVRAGNNTTDITGTSTVTVGGTATVKTLAASGNAGVDVANVVMNINAGTVESLLFTGTNADATNGNVTVNLNAGTVNSIGKGAGAIKADSTITVNVGTEFEMGTMSVAVETALGDGNTITSTLNLGEVAEEPADTLKAEFDTVNYTLPVVESASTVYVSGSAADGGDGSKEAPFQTLDQAYTYIATNSPNEGGKIVIKGDITLSGNTDLETNYTAITGTVELTSKVSDTESYDATITSSATLNFYPSASTYIHDLDWNSTGQTTYFYTGKNMVIGDNFTSLPESGSKGLKIFASTKAADANTDISLTVGSGLYHSLFLGGRTGSTTGDITVTMTGGTVRNFFVLGPNSSSDSPSVSGNLTVTINGGTIAQLCTTPDTAATVGDVVVNLNGGELNDFAVKGASTTMKSVTVNVADTFSTTAASLGSWEGSTVTNGTTLNLKGYLGNAGFGGYKVVNIQDNAEITYSGELTDQNITVESGSVLILTYPNYTDVSALPADVTITAAQGGTVTDAAYGKVYYKEITYPSVVYVDGTVSASGDGLTAATAVKTLPEAYKLLSPVNGGTVVICGTLTVTENTNLESISGKVIITSVYDNVDYRTTCSASLNFPASVRIYFGNETYIRNMNIVCGSGTVYVYCGRDMTFGEGLDITQNKTLKLFTTDSSVVSSAANAVDYKLTILSGDYESIWLGGLTANAYIGNVEYTQGGTASVRLLIMAGNKGVSGNIIANMEGGTVTKLTTNGANAAGLTVGNVIVNLKGCAVKALTAYGGNVIYGQSFTVNVYMDKIPSLPSEMGYFDKSYLPNTTTRIPTTLNYLNYNGSSVPAGDYDVVNLFGSSEMPTDYVSPAESGKNVLAIHGFTGITSVDLSSFDKLIVTGSSDVTCAGEVPTSLVLSATGSKLRIRPSQQPTGTTLADYTISNNDQVLWEDPAYTEYDVLFDIDFEDGYTATGNVTVNSVNNGYTTSFQNGGFVTGFDGNTGLYFVNEFGASAQNYLTIDLSDSGYDITKQDYTVTFWYRTENGGNDQWARGVHATVAGTLVDMPSYNMGGTIFSNQDTKLDTAGMSFLQLTHYKYTSAGFTAADGTHCDADGIWQAQDDTWHHIVVSYDRDGYYCVYVDGELITATDISAYADNTLGVNALTFGADAMGQYGLGNAIIDDITVFSGALNVVDAQAQYYASCIDALAYEINTRLDQLGAEYDSYKDAMRNTLTETLANVADMDAADYADLLAAFNALISSYESFLANPEKDALLTMLLSSDIHFGSGDTVERFDNLLGQLVELGVDLDVIMSAGDFADKPDSDIVTQAYTDLFNMMNKYGLTDTLFVNCLGNHDAYYRTNEANYQTAIPLYWQYMMAHMEDMIEDGTVTLDYASYYTDDDGIVQSCSYAVTFQGYHFLVINTDYPEGGQTDNSGNYKDENGNYSIEGNEVDPIRHTMHLKDETLEWMDALLDEWAKDGMPIFAAGHYLFENTCPLSFNSEIIINSNTIGKQDQQLREILAAHKNVFYFCGHVHASLGVIDPWNVEVEGIGSFWELNLSAIKAAARAYMNVPATWIMYVYEDEVVLRARDFSIGEWLTEFDVVIKLDCPHLAEDVEHVTANDSSCSAAGNSEYWHCKDCDKYFCNANCTTEIEKDSWVIEPKEHEYLYACDKCCSVCFNETNPDAEHELTHVLPKEATEEADGNIEYWYCELCERYYADEAATEEISCEDTIVTFNPDTGDSSMLILAALLSLLSITGTALLISKKD